MTIVGVALPSIRQDLGFSESSLAWVANAYLLTFGGFLLLAGRYLQLVLVERRPSWSPAWIGPPPSSQATSEFATLQDERPDHADTSADQSEQTTAHRNPS